MRAGLQVAVLVLNQLGSRLAAWRNTSGQRLGKELREQGLPEWNIILDEPKGNKPKTETLEVLIWHLRNAAAHGRFEFADNPDSPDLEKVRVVAKDKPLHEKEINWHAEIRGDRLYEFCCNLAELIIQANN